jgi:beta-glucosidase-like glycosyl hydrolase
VRRILTLNKHAHLVLTLLLISSTSALYFSDEQEKKTDARNATLPSFEGIELNKSGKTVNLDSMTTRQKAALLIVSTSYESNVSDNRIVGGVHLSAAKSEEEFNERVASYREGRLIEPLITIDLEGCITPADSFRSFRAFHHINTTDQAYRSGLRQGEFLSNIGVDINFSPVVDLEDSIWGCRSFPGNQSAVSDKACAYIEGLHEKEVMATAKHYPGRTLTGKDPHHDMKNVNVTERDLAPFYATMNCSVDAVMPSHQISTGYVNTRNQPADVSEVTRNRIREKGFDGLIVSDAIDMGGLTKYYNSSEQRYIDAFRANDVILNVIGDVEDTVEIINTIDKAVENDRLDEKYIDQSLTRLLEAKGWEVESDRN